MCIRDRIRRDENWEQGSVPCIRTDLLEEQGLEVPTTWDELYSVPVSYTQLDVYKRQVLWKS